MRWFDENTHFYVPVQSSSINFLHSPQSFYNTLLERISSSQKRIILAALYLGNGQKEKELVDRLQRAVRQNPSLKVGILLDYFRGTRGGTNSSSAILTDLSSNEAVHVSFFRTPIWGKVKDLLPERLNEIAGLQHMKFFIFDDSILISGANLSDQYFVNRQDRYLLIENSPILADFFQTVFDLFAQISFRLESGGKLTSQQGTEIATQKFVLDNLDKLFHEFESRIREEQNLQAANSSKPSNDSWNETFVCPFFQMGPFNINHEIELFTRLFSQQQENIELTLVTAYFNLHDIYAHLLLKNKDIPLAILFGSPQANGFFGASGLSGHIPSLYAQNALNFMEKVTEISRQRTQFLEWDRPNWTFHAKGIWIDSPHTTRAATIVGSSNFGYRSAHRDLEAQILLVTENEALKRRMADEKKSLFEHAQTLDLEVFLRRDHLIPSWVKFFSRIFRNFF